MIESSENTSASIEAIAFQAAQSRSLTISDLPAGIVLTVETESGSTYSFEIVDPVKRHAIEAGEKTIWKSGDRVRIDGSLVGGSTTSWGHVRVGHILSLTHTTKRDDMGLPNNGTTSRVRRILLNGVQILPPPPTGFKS